MTHRIRYRWRHWVTPWIVVASACVPLAPAQKHAAVQKAANEGHAGDQSLPVEAREIGATNAQAWATQERYLRGESE